MIDCTPIFLSLKLGVVTVIILLCISLPVAYVLSYTKLKRYTMLEALINLPLILPPSVLGFYLLYFLSPNHMFGKIIESLFHVRIVFSFTSLVIASVIFSFPIMVNSFKTGLNSVPSNYIDCANVLGLNKLKTLKDIILPYCRKHILSGVVLTFAHTIGAFGILLMIGGNIQGKTRLASIAIFNEVESMNYAGAHVYSVVLLVLTILILFVLIKVNKLYEPSKEYAAYKY